MSAPSPTKAALEAAIRDAHPPTLILTMVHLTGDESLLKPEWLPVYNPLDPNDIGVPEEEQAKIRAKGAEVLGAYFAGKLEPKKLPIR